MPHQSVAPGEAVHPVASQTSQVPVPTAKWYLEPCASDAGSPRRVLVSSKTPFLVGRDHHLAVCLPSPYVSNVHAELVLQDGALLVRDLDSTNGTYINGERVCGFSSLNEGDLLQLGRDTYRVGKDSPQECRQTVCGDCLDIAFAVSNFDRLMTDRAVVPHFQPIVRTADLTLEGYEILARSDLEGLETPRAMFAIAKRFESEGPLSVLLRQEGIQIGLEIARRPNLFVNTHPGEVVTGELIESLKELRTVAPTQPITLEIHEEAVTDSADMSELRAVLHDLDMQLAYDDFGAGQARLDALIQVPPDYVKFDVGLIRNIHRAEPPHLGMIKMLVEIVHNAGAAALAEGVECEEAVTICRELGFEYAQGFHLGRPAPANELPV